MTTKLRARQLGVPFEGKPGPLNAITDVAGVTVGHVTLINGQGPPIVGKGPVRTGVTIIHPLGRNSANAVTAGRAVINGTGEWTGMHFVDELGQFFGPIALTGTGSVGVVHKALVDWAARLGTLSTEELFMRLLPVVGETLDSQLHDVFGHALMPEHVFAALDEAKAGAVAEGNVGGGTGMVAYEFKGGIGTASRVVEFNGQSYTVGVLLQANHARRAELRIAGVPVGVEIADLRPGPKPSLDSPTRETPSSLEHRKNSLLVVIATDAPLQAHQLSRLARRAALGIGRSGSTAGNLSGEFVLAFSTTNTHPVGGHTQIFEAIHDNDSAAMGPLFTAAVRAVEEALVNQLVASETLDGIDDTIVHALPHDRLIAALRKYNRLAPDASRLP
jgi:L-aminopeptidase/D-esterase-like protein